ncbi:hypothetical protein LCG94_00560 [Aeromonas salmonicida]
MKWLSFSVIALISSPVAASQVEVLHGWSAVGTDHSPSLKAVTV